MALLYKTLENSSATAASSNYSVVAAEPDNRLKLVGLFCLIALHNRLFHAIDKKLLNKICELCKKVLYATSSSYYNSNSISLQPFSLNLLDFFKVGFIQITCDFMGKCPKGRQLKLDCSLDKSFSMPYIFFHKRKKMASKLKSWKNLGSSILFSIFEEIMVYLKQRIIMIKMV